MKIEGFAGKFQLAATEGAVVSQPTLSTPARQEEKIRPAESFKLKKALEESVQEYTSKKTAEPTVTKTSIQARDEFDERKVLSAFEAYIQLYHPETTIIVALTSHKPEIDGNTVRIEVDNKLQLEKLEVIKLQLQNLLIKRLNNGFITLSFKFFDNSDGKELKKLYTAQDKFEHFVVLNPVVQELKNMFGLELD